MQAPRLLGEVPQVSRDRVSSEGGNKMRVTTERAEEIASCHSGGDYKPVYAELAADLLEARELLRKVAREFGDSKSQDARRARLTILAYFAEEV